MFLRIFILHTIYPQEIFFFTPNTQSGQLATKTYSRLSDVDEVAVCIYSESENVPAICFHSSFITKPTSTQQRKRERTSKCAYCTFFGDWNMWGQYCFRKYNIFANTLKLSLYWCCSIDSRGCYTSAHRKMAMRARERAWLVRRFLCSERIFV